MAENVTSGEGAADGHAQEEEEEEEEEEEDAFAMEVAAENATGKEVSLDRLYQKKEH